MADQQQPVQVRIDESKMATTYANVFRTFNLGEGMVIDFGLNLPQQTQQGQPPATHFGIGSRVVMTWPAVKQLAATMGQAVKAYEERFGEIPTPNSNRNSGGDEGTRFG